MLRRRYRPPTFEERFGDLPERADPRGVHQHGHIPVAE